MSPAPPRVLQVVWNLIRGGTEGQCARVALGLAAHGVSTRVAVSRREGFFLDPVEQALGPVHVLDIHRLLHPHTVREVLRLARFIRAERMDLVHAWDADAAVFGALAARWAGVPLVTSRRDLGEIYHGWKARAMQRADRRAAGVVVNARAIGDRLQAIGLPPARIHLIPNILDIDEFDRQAARPFTQAAQLGPGSWIVHVARLDPEKDVATLLRAAALVAPQAPDARWALAGDGVERGRLEALCDELNLRDRVLFLGDVQDVPALLKRGVVAVLCPNFNEGLSNSILEYQAAGLPVVATDCGGNKELVADGDTGFVVPAGDAPQLAARLLDLLGDPARAARMGQAGRARVESNHRPEQICTRFAALYRQVLSAR